MNRDRAMLLLYAAAVLTATLVHDVQVLIVGLILTGLVARRDAAVVARRAGIAVAMFAAVVTAAYVAMGTWRGEVSWEFVALLNVRVFLLTSLSVLVAMKVNLFRALDFSTTLVFVLTVAWSQALTFRRLHEDFRLAFTSRAVGRVRALDRYRHAAATASYFLRRALRETGDITMAMTSRGFFDGPVDEEAE